MGFRENLIQKLEIIRLADKVSASISPTDSSKRIDRESMTQLLGTGAFKYHKERDLDLYFLDQHHILLLDNELKIYATTVDDIALRKSPTVKEMISIRNAIKILNDKDVVVSRKGDTVQRIKTELVDRLDLSFTADDIQSMANDGIEAMENKYVDGIVEILTLFADLLEYHKAPKAFRLTHHHVWGRIEKLGTGEKAFGPLFMFDLMHNNLKMYLKTTNPADREAMGHYHAVAKGREDADLNGADVLTALARAVLAKPE